MNNQQVGKFNNTQFCERIKILYLGYYRVDYDEKLWTEILNSLNSNIDSIDEMSRSQIVDDLLNFAKANKKNYGDVFEKLKFLENDSSYYSWYSAFANFNYLLPKLDDGLRKDVDVSFDLK